MLDDLDAEGLELPLVAVDDGVAVVLEEPPNRDEIFYHMEATPTHASAAPSVEDVMLRPHLARVAPADAAEPLVPLVHGIADALRDLERLVIAAGWHVNAR
jgi:hypothetical protein